MSVRQPRMRIVIPKMPNQRDITSMWDKLRDSLEKLQDGRAIGTECSYQELYKMAYNIVMSNKADVLYKGIDDVIRTRLKAEIPNLLAPPEENAISRVTNLYGQHYQAMLRFRDVLLYLDSRRGRSHRPVFDLGITYFTEEVVKHPQIEQQLRDEMISLVKKFRAGETIDRALLKKGTATLIEIGLASDEPRALYRDVFENTFLVASKLHYENKSRRLLQNHTCVEYLELIQKSAEDEIRLVDQCLHASTEGPLTQVVYQTMIGAHTDELLANDDVSKMLRTGQVTELRLLFSLMSKVPEGIAKMQARLEAHISKVGAAHLASEDVQNDTAGPVDLVRDFTDEMAKYMKLQSEAFQKNPDMQLAINRPFTALLNGHKRIAEYLSLYIDHTMKNNNTISDDPATEELLDGIVWVFRLIHEKDLFEKFFKQHLARRLLSGKKVMEVEQLLVQRFKKECGGEYTSRIESMFKDMQISDDLMKKFDTDNDGRTLLGNLSFNARVLGTNVWPMSSSSATKFPPELQSALNVYQEFYQGWHKKRKLTWQSTLGSMTVSARFGGLKMFHTISMSTGQGLVLLQFNGPVDKDPQEISFETLKAGLDLKDSDIKRAIHALSQEKQQILVKVKGAGVNAIGASDTFTLNKSFTSKKTRIKIPQLVAKESAVEQKATAQKMEEDRKLETEAAIVRVMKARKTLRFNQLVVEVTDVMSKRCMPRVSTIKQVIERLIDSEYLERSSTDQYELALLDASSTI